MIQKAKRAKREKSRFRTGKAVFPTCRGKKTLEAEQVQSGCENETCPATSEIIAFEVYKHENNRMHQTCVEGKRQGRFV